MNENQDQQDDTLEYIELITGQSLNKPTPARSRFTRQAPPPTVKAEPSKPKLNKPWRGKLAERTRSEIERTAGEKFLSDQARIAVAVEAKWKRTKIRRGWLKYKTDWIREIMDSDPHEKKKNFQVKQNLIRETNQYILDIMDCLTTDAMLYPEAEPLVRYNLYGLRKEWVKVRVGNKWADMERVPILAPLDVPAIVERINFKRARQKQGPIKQGVIWTASKGWRRRDSSGGSGRGEG